MTKDQEVQLIKIYKKHKELTPDLVLSYAKNSNNALHACFEWDNEKAGESHRKWQARQLIRCVVIPVATPTGNIITRAFVNLKEDPDANFLQKSTKLHYYKHVNDLTEDEKARILRNAMVEIAEWRNKYQSYFTEFSSIMRIIDKKVIPALQTEVCKN